MSAPARAGRSRRLGRITRTIGPRRTGASGSQLLASMGAVFAIDAAQSVSGEQWVLNRGSGGQVLRARYGSVGRAEIRNGVGLVTPSNSGNTPTVPDSADLRISGTLEILGRFEGNTRPATTGYLALKSSDGTYANRWYGAVLYNSGQLGLWCRDTAMNSVDKGSVSAIPSTTTSFWWKVNVNPATGVFNFYYAPDQIDEPAAWTDLGGTTGSFVGNAILTGSGGDVRGHHLVDGVQKRLMIRNAIGSGTVLDVDFTAQADLATSFTCTTGQTVTVAAANAVDTNDPLWCGWAGENYVYVPAGSASNNAYVPSASNLSATTQFEVIQRVWLADWTPATTSILGQRTAFADPDYHWSLALLTGGQLRLTIFPLATAASSTQIDSTVAVPLTDGKWYWLRVTFNGNDGAGNRRTNFYYAADQPSVPAAWTQIGTEVVTASTVSFTAPTAANLYMVGANGSAPDVACKRFIYRTTIGGSNILDVDFTANTSHSSFVCSTGQTVTLGRTTSGRKTAVVTRPIWLFGTDDYLEVADNDLLDFTSTDDFTILAVGRIWATPLSNGRIIDKSDSASAAPGYTLYTIGASNDIRTYMFGATSVVSPGLASLNFTYGNLSVFAGIANRTAQTLTSYVNTTSGGTEDISAVGSVASNGAMRIGNRAAGARPQDMELLAVGIFRRALTSSDIAKVVAAFGA